MAKWQGVALQSAEIWDLPQPWNATKMHQIDNFIYIGQNIGNLTYEVCRRIIF